MSLKTLILAAGKGTRMKSELPKVLHQINGNAMLHKILEVVNSLQPEENILILGYKREEILKTLVNCSYVVQEEQLGTGHAILQAKEKLERYHGDIMVLMETLLCYGKKLFRLCISIIESKKQRQQY